MLLVDTKWNSGLYDKEKDELTKVLKIYSDDFTASFSRCEYAYSEDGYREATNEDIKEHKHEYYDDNGNLPLV